MDPQLAAYLKKIARPGAVWLTSGERGGGKTHTAVAVMEKLVKGKVPGMRKVIVCTNIIFYHKVGGNVLVEPPPGVHHITTMKELWPIVVDTIETYGRDVLIMLILDEAQGFIAGDNNFTNSSIPMKEMLGTIRKYSMMVWFLTPTARSVGPMFRNLINAKKNPGNITCRWKKDLELNQQWIDQCKLDSRPQEWMAVIPYDAPPVMMRIPVTEWTGVLEDLKEGQYCYDHVASATFKEGDGFDFNAFNDFLGGVASIYAMDAIKEFYAKMKAGETAEGGEAEMSERERKLVLATKLHDEYDLTWEDAAAAAEIPFGTLKTWRTQAKKEEKMSKKSAIGTHPSKSVARQTDGWMTGGSKSPRIYISKRTGGNEGDSGENSSAEARDSEEIFDPSEDASEGVPDGIGEACDTPLPDGRYTMSEMRRAVHHCIGGDGDEAE